ncbi:hypothetical protein GETHLI_14470 [Geothrix limicola]|uniref:Porin n=1 Tax=Geothrix limicola TaxID=2927978 RepID=A0ABQ5QET8_9BACT|nr:porin [Geothrix limicola]GLH72945.1 hypothetical protein GETHLI_14470 [Geothrix limicola]
MTTFFRAALVGSALTTLSPLFAQDATPSVHGLLQLWYDQTLHRDLRNDKLATTNSNTYYDLPSNFIENSLVIRRAQIQVNGETPGAPGLSYLAMLDLAINPTSVNASNSNAPYNPGILQDVYLTYTFSNAFDLRVGQFKNLQTYEGLASPAELLFAERSQLGRRFADKRDRGIVLGWRFGRPGLQGKASLGVFNGTNDLAAGKANDLNAQKDWAGRIQIQAGSHTFGAYGLSGGTDQKDGSCLVAKTFPGPLAPSAQTTLHQGDRTTNAGAFWAFDDRTWHADAEVITGLWGRRYPSVGAQAGAAGRESLDQRFLSWYASLARTFGRHVLALRYDTLNANHGSFWTTAFDPYRESAPGVPRLANGAPIDLTPKYVEFTTGYTYSLTGPENRAWFRASNVKLNHIRRGHHFLAPGAGEAGTRGDDSLLAALQATY